MTGNLEINDQDVQDLYHVIICYLKEHKKPSDPKRPKRLEDLKDRLLKVDVNDT
jgi:hypothetical protein